MRHMLLDETIGVTGNSILENKRFEKWLLKMS